MLRYDTISNKDFDEEVYKIQCEKDPIEIYYNDFNYETFLILGILFAMNKKIKIINLKGFHESKNPIKEVIIKWLSRNEIPDPYIEANVNNVVFISSRENREIDKYPQNKNLFFINYNDNITYEEAQRRKKIIGASADMYTIVPYDHPESYFYLGICYYYRSTNSAKELRIKENYSDDYINISYYKNKHKEYVRKLKDEH